MASYRNPIIKLVTATQIAAYHSGNPSSPKDIVEGLGTALFQEEIITKVFDACCSDFTFSKGQDIEKMSEVLLALTAPRDSLHAVILILFKDTEALNSLVLFDCIGVRRAQDRYIVYRSDKHKVTHESTLYRSVIALPREDAFYRVYFFEKKQAEESASVLKKKRRTNVVATVKKKKTPAKEEESIGETN